MTDTAEVSTRTSSSLEVVIDLANGAVIEEARVLLAEAQQRGDDVLAEALADELEHLIAEAETPLLPEVLDVMQAVQDFVQAVVRGELERQRSRPYGHDRVHVRRISMNSPLVMDLIVTGTGTAGVASAVVYLFKNPDKLGEWFPKLQAAWYNGRVEAEKARKAYEKLKKARTKVRELQP